jgi:hypothetical protein
MGRDDDDDDSLLFELELVLYNWQIDSDCVRTFMQPSQSGSNGGRMLSHDDSVLSRKRVESVG